MDKLLVIRVFFYERQALSLSLSDLGSQTETRNEQLTGKNGHMLPAQLIYSRNWKGNMSIHVQFVLRFPLVNGGTSTASNINIV